jgi:hypothetical protein
VEGDDVPEADAPRRDPDAAPGSAGVAPREGERLPRPFGPYTLLREIGRGAMGVVYEALQRDLGRSVALKVLRTGFDTGSDALERFRREARACAQVRHDHIVQVYEAGEAEGRPYYAMDLLPGRTLAEAIAAKEVPAAPDLLRALAEVADALEALHRAGVFHRDVKPSNILVRPDGRMVLADFGLARTAAAATLTRTGDLLGTPLYMSPEQVLGERAEVDARTDVYGLGATAYEALAGRPVFQTESIPALTAMILARRPEPLRRVAPDVASDAERIVLKALEKRKEDRYPTAAALRDDMRAFAAGARVAGRPVPRPLRAARWVARHRFAAGALVLAVAGGAYAWSHRPATVVIDSVPGAEAVLDGVERGPVPWTTSTTRGKHVVLVRHDRFQEREKTVVLEPGSNRFEIALWPRDATDPEALSLLGGWAGVPMERLALPRAEREPPEGEGVELWIPRGEVRPADFRVLSMSVDADRVKPSGTLEIRSEGATLWTAPFHPPHGLSTVVVPAEVRARLPRTGTVTWGWWPVGGRPVTANARLVDGDAVTTALRTLDARLADAPDDVARQLRAQWLLDRGLATAAFLEAWPLARPGDAPWLGEEAVVADPVIKDPDPTDPPAGPPDVRALSVQHRALVALGLEESRGAASLAAEIRGAPRERLERVFRTVPGALGE